MHTVSGDLVFALPEGYTGTYMGFVPLTEGGGIDLDDGTLDESVGTNKFVVGCIVDLIPVI